MGFLKWKIKNEPRMKLCHTCKTIFLIYKRTSFLVTRVAQLHSRFIFLTFLKNLVFIVKDKTSVRFYSQKCSSKTNDFFRRLFQKNK